MKTPVSTLTQIAVVVLTVSGCNKTDSDSGGKRIPPPPPPTAVRITLHVDADNPDIGLNQKLDFFLPTAKPGTKYWVTFLNQSPCTKEGSDPTNANKYSGTYEEHATCRTKAKTSSNSHYVFTWGSIPPTPTNGGVNPYNAIKCQPWC